MNIFSTVPDAPSDTPLTTITEHSFGIRCVAFSPNSRWLATLGEANDGFLFVWSINPKTGGARLQFTNKCTASVLDMAWCANNLITVGTRYVKVWRVGDPSSGVQTKQGRSLLEGDGGASPAPKTLSGRNSLLGSLADSTFTCVAPISDCEAVICTQTGNMCLLDDRSGNQELQYLKQLSPSAQSTVVDPHRQRIWFADCDGRYDSESFEGLKNTEASRHVIGVSAVEETTVGKLCPSPPAASDALCAFQSPPTPGSRKRKRRDGFIASIYLPDRIVSIDGDRNIRIEWVGDGIRVADSERSSVIKLPAHNAAVYGVVSLSKPAAMGHFVTWSLEGAVSFWSLDGSIKRSERVELEQLDQSALDQEEYVNELRVVRTSADAQSIVSGDRLGVLQVIECQSWVAIKVRAHSAEITDIGLNGSERCFLVATCSRDRTVQLLQHRSGEIELLQTFDDHVASVTAVDFTGDFLISASSDRTVIVRQKVKKVNTDGTELLAYLPHRVITLKASPTSITVVEPYVLVVATMDKHILTFNITTGVAGDGFKALDAEGDDAVVLNSLTIRSVEDASGSRRILAGFSSTDKSIRLYDFDRGTVLARELGHTEGISDVAVLDHVDESAGQDRKLLISTGLDGLIMVWRIVPAQLRLPLTPLQEFSQGRAMNAYASADTPIRDSILRRPPLRKVLSKLDVGDVNELVPSVSSSRDQFSPCLKKKMSKYSLGPPKLGGLSTAQSALRTLPSESDSVAEPNCRMKEPSPIREGIINDQSLLGHESPLPPSVARSPEIVPDDRHSVIRCPGERSPSPRRAPPSLPTTPKAVNRANRGRLRRPPSVPSDLRSQSRGPTDWKSVGTVHEFGSIGMASEQVCRALRAYRKMIKATPRTEQLQLEELEVELLATLQAVEERRQRNESRRAEAATENDLDNLSRLMKSSGTGDWAQQQQSLDSSNLDCDSTHGDGRSQDINRPEDGS